MWPPKVILHPTDFSECSRHAFDLACDLAGQNRGKVIVLHAHPPALLAASEFPQSVEIEDEEEARRKLQMILPVRADVPVEHRLLSGQPVEVILTAVRVHRPDLVVMGTQGRRGVSRLLLGSVAEEVVRRSSCPVLLSRPALPEPRRRLIRAANRFTIGI